MGLLSWLFERKATDVSNYTWSELFPGHVKSGVSVNVWTALRTTTVLACSRVLAEGVAQMPLNLFDIDPVNNTKTKNITHPAYHLLSCEPNDWMTAFELREMMTMHAVLTGNAYAYLGWSGPANNRTLVEIIPLVPHQVVVNRETDYTLTYSVTDLTGKTTTLAAEDVLHLRGPSWDGYLGMDAVQLAREAIGLAIATEETHASLHANGAQPGGVLSVKGKLDKDARNRLKEQWQQFQGGVSNRFKTAVLDVDASWNSLAMTGVDSQHLETRRFQIEEICRSMRVFPQMVMHSDKTSTFASAGAFFQAHVDHSLMPWVLRWEQAINRVILGDDDNLIAKLNVNIFLRGDAAARSDFYMKALGGARGETAYMTRNEVRELEDLNPIAGGDELLIPQIAAPSNPGTDVNDPTNDVVKMLVGLLAKYNDNHDELGRFATGSGGADVTSRLYSAPTKTAGQIVQAAGAEHFVKAVENRLAESVPTNAPVSHGGFVGANGEYTPERQAVQDEVLNKIFNSEAVKAAMPAPGEQPTLSVIGGRGGSGKSFVTGPNGPVDPSKSLLLDSDKIKEMLPGYQGWNAGLYHEEATTILAKADAIATQLGINVVHDATLKSEASSSVRQSGYRAAGYKVNGYYVHASPETAATRALGRAMKPGGRYVPPSVILGNTENEKNFDKMKTGFANWRVYDNNGAAPKLIAQGKN